MTNPHHPIQRLFILGVLTLLVSGLVSACRPAPTATVPNIHDVVATGMAGTQNARALGTMVSATQAALAVQAQTPAPTGALSPARPTNTAAPASAINPPADPCQGGGTKNLSYVDEQGGFCLFYPADFFVNKPVKGVVEFLGPALDKSAQPLRAYITISRKDAVLGRTLDEIALNLWTGPRSAYRLSNIRLDGQDALAADDLQIGEASWKVKQVIYTHSGFVYLISLSPVDSTPPFDKVLPDIQRFWDLAIPSFKFR